MNNLERGKRLTPLDLPCIEVCYNEESVEKYDYFLGNREFMSEVPDDSASGLGLRQSCGIL